MYRIYKDIGWREERWRVTANVYWGDENILELDTSNVFTEDFPGGSGGKVSVYNAGDLGSIPGLGRSPGEGNGNPLQYPCLENSMDGGTLSMGSQRVGRD